MTLSSIAAMAKNRVIGKAGDLPWNIPEDMAFFRKKTANSIIIMGRKTLESFPKFLPGRFHIIITRQADYTPPAKLVGKSDEFLVVTNVDEALAAAEALVKSEPKWGTEVFNIGGGEIYKALLPQTDRIYLTEIDTNAEGDTVFPSWEANRFIEIERIPGQNSGKNGAPNYDFVVYHRRP